MGFRRPPVCVHMHTKRKYGQFTRQDSVRSAHLILLCVVSHLVEVEGEVAEGVVVDHGEVEDQPSQPRHLLHLSLPLLHHGQELPVPVT